MIGSLNGSSFGAFYDPCYAWELGWPFVWSFSWLLLFFKARMALGWGAFYGSCSSWELGWPFVENFSWLLLCFESWMAFRSELLIALAMLKNLEDLLLGAFHGPSYALEFGCFFSGSIS